MLGGEKTFMRFAWARLKNTCMEAKYIVYCIIFINFDIRILKYKKINFIILNSIDKRMV